MNPPRLQPRVLALVFSMVICAGELRALDERFDHPDPKKVGAWETLIPEDNGAAVNGVLAMQAVHAVMLPSGKVLVASGSSWRNRAPVEYYPKDTSCDDPKLDGPCPGQGAIRREDDPFKNDKRDEYYRIVNNVAIYDPEENTYFRIPHPTPPRDPRRAGHFAANDLFCTGHLQLADGNVLFAGGTQYYYPYRTGSKATYLFDWREEMKVDWSEFQNWGQVQDPGSKFYPWRFSGFMKRGRWYPHMVPLLDGRLALFGGFVGFDDGYFGEKFPVPYQFEINTYVEFFDPSKFDPANLSSAWRSVDVRKSQHSPFNTRLDMTFLRNYLVERGFLTGQVKPRDLRKYIGKQCHARCADCGDECGACISRCTDDQYRDAFKLYPNNYLLDDGRIYLTREGEWVSARTDDTVFMRRTKFTYFMEIGGTREAPAVTFSEGPARPEVVTSYGTSFLDPSSGDISILGGQPSSAGTLLPLNAQVPTRFAGGRGSRKIETFAVPASRSEQGSWSIEENFLGTDPQDDRTMHIPVILPTKQVLVVNGGNYDFYGPIYHPLLMTPKAGGGYRTSRMSEAVQPRLYHNTALLLPDARVLVMGGNSARATVHVEKDQIDRRTSEGQPKPNLGAVDVDMYFFRDGQMAKGEKGILSVPTELWVGEIFSPPYLFIDGGRRPAIAGLRPEAGGPDLEPIEGTFYDLHSRATYTVDLESGSLPSSCSVGTGGSMVLMKLPAATHGWDSGQRLIDLSARASGRTGVVLTMPDRMTDNVPPGFYMLFYVDCMGVPSKARMVRFDFKAAM